MPDRRAFFPTDPQDKMRTAAELENWNAENKAKKKEKRTETRRYWITTAISVLALVISIIALVKSC